jgi:hypothetical protein
MSRPFWLHQESQYRYPASAGPTTYNRRVDERQSQNTQSRYGSENCRYMYDYENNTSPIDTSSSLSSPIVDTTAGTYVKSGENERRQYRSPATRTQHFHRFDCSPSVTGRNVEFEHGKSRPHEVYQYSTAGTTLYKIRRERDLPQRHIAPNPFVYRSKLRNGRQSRPSIPATIVEENVSNLSFRNDNATQPSDASDVPFFRQSDYCSSAPSSGLQAQPSRPWQYRNDVNHFSNTKLDLARYHDSAHRNNTIAFTDASKRTTTPSSIQIAPGQFLRLRGADETWKAVRCDFYKPCECSHCWTTIFCMNDVDYVLCPICREVSPVPRDDDAAMTHAKGGVGLGFTMQNLAKWQADIEGKYK